MSVVSMVSGARFAEIVENEHSWPLCVSPWILSIEVQRHRPETSSPMLRVLNIAEEWQDEQSQNKSMPYARCFVYEGERLLCHPIPVFDQRKFGCQSSELRSFKITTIK